MGEDEYAGALVGCADVGRSYNAPFRVIPEGGKVAEYAAECSESRTVWSVSHKSRSLFHVAR